VIESFLEGQEYSCDFILVQRHLKIIRTAKKHIASDQPIGTTLAYAIPAALPPQLDQQNFKHQLYTAARSLGLKRAVCMVDFIVKRDVAFLLEMTPRPGGDCLPWMIRQSCGLDMLGLAMDFAEGIPVHIPDASRWKPVVGLRLLAETAGVIQHIDGSGLKQSSSVRDFRLKVRPGSRIKLPPQDYDSRVLGHVIFQPDPSQSVQMQCSALRTKLKIEMRTDR
jgi:hypothetical protein